MKSKEELLKIFSVFDNNNSRFLEVLTGTSWTIAAFRPFKRDGIIIYSFRVYGEVSGSKFTEYNKKKQWCGGVDYHFDPTKNELSRSQYEHQLNIVVQRNVDVENLLQTI